MEAVILAAGLGTRLRPLTENFPKPLLKVAGRELLYRHLRLLSEHGIQNFVLVINPGHQKYYEAFLAKHQEFKVKLVLNPSPERGNGYSFYLARDHLSGPFVLTMGDHVYERDLVARALTLEGLIVDQEGLYIEPEEATKALCERGRVRALGKDLRRFTGFDTGFFVITDPEAVFSVAERLIEEKDEVSLSEIMAGAEIPCSELSGLLWLDVDTLADLKRATRLLIKHAVKGSGDGLVSRYLNRRVSTWFSARLVNHLTPNKATLLTSLLGLIAAVVLGWAPKLAALLYQLSSMLDGMDGEIARASLRESSYGGWLDSVLDRVVDFAFLLGLYLIWKPTYPWEQLLALFTLFGAVMVSYTSERYRGAFGKDLYREIPALRHIPGKRDERVFFIMVGVLLGKIRETFFGLALFTWLKVALTVALVSHKHLKGK